MIIIGQESNFVMVTGIYTGNNVAQRTISGLGITPRFMIVYPQSAALSNGYAIMFASNQDGGNTFVPDVFNEENQYEGGDVYQFVAGGFKISNQGQNTGTNYANISGVVYTFIAFA